MHAEVIIRALTICSLAGLLLGVGLRLTVAEVIAAVRRCRLLLIVGVNFLVIPALAIGAIKVMGIRQELAMGMILLAAAPFAPVVPVFARMARADLALAAGLTALFPVLSAFLTAPVVGVALQMVPGAGGVQFDMGDNLVTLLAIITVPLSAGVLLNQFAPEIGRRVLKPVEMVSEFAGALSLTFVTVTEWRMIAATDGRALLGMGILFEVALMLGLLMGGRDRRAARVIGLGTSNRNIALALLVALESFPGTTVAAAVVANGLLLIFLGLLHVAYWRFVAKSQAVA